MGYRSTLMFGVKKEHKHLIDKWQEKELKRVNEWRTEQRKKFETEWNKPLDELDYFTSHEQKDYKDEDWICYQSEPFSLKLHNDDLNGLLEIIEELSRKDEAFSFVLGEDGAVDECWMKGEYWEFINYSYTCEFFQQDKE